MSGQLPGTFRKVSIGDRRTLVSDQYPAIAPSDLGTDPEMLELADVMVESAVGYLAIPVGVASGVVVDDVAYDVPMATEEPSVIAAAGYGASIVRRSGGFLTSGGEPVTTGQLYVEDVSPAAGARVEAAEAELAAAAAHHLDRMTARGGGWRGLDTAWLEASRVLRIHVHVDVRDAMGANIVNSVMESLRAPVEAITNGRVVMAILTNTADRRLTTARFSVPVARLARGGVDGAEAARRIAVAARIAREDRARAVTHNKGIMNGVTAVSLATGNDTRAIEAAVHEYASRDGYYRALTRYDVSGGELHGELTLPLPLGTVGGAAGMHPATRACHELLGRPGSLELARIVASVGLAQNFAALFALVTEGIQRGHMGLHANRVAWAAGARGAERGAVVDAMRNAGTYSSEFARETLAMLRGSHDS